MSRLVGSVCARSLLLIAPPFPLSTTPLARKTSGSLPLPRSHSSVGRLTLNTSAQPSDANALCFRVATYNLLSSHLADQQHFPQCDPANLDAHTRLQRVKAKLESEVDQGSIVCLQEVSARWAGDLHVFFMARGYTLVTASYGSVSNGYMGVALAWPLASYEAVTVDITRLSETRDWDKGGPGEQTRKPPQASPIDSPSALSRRWRRFLSFLRRLTGQGEGRDGKDSDGEGRVVEDPWKISQRRFNQALFARLRPRRTNTLASGAAASSLAAHNGESFCVGTYHMPCMFRIPPVMTIHTSMIVKHISRLAGTDPFVLAGDFNFVPDSACYKIVTEGGMSSTCPDFPQLPEWEKDWSPATGLPLVSAYKEVEGKEPDFTNNAKVGDWPPFVETLDYIFHTPSLTATKVLPLGKRDHLDGPYPTEKEPSDHVLLAAEYKLRSTPNGADSSFPTR